MLVWILGAEGLVGRALQVVFKQKKVSFIASGKKEADLTQIEMVAFPKVSHIVNCAARVDVDGCEQDAANVFRVNAEGPGKLAALAAQKGMRLIHISTDYVFDGTKKSPYVETDACNPINVYGKSKREGEVRVLEAHKNACIIRPSSIFGPWRKNFLTSLIEYMETRQEVLGIVDQVSRPTYSLDLAEAIHALLDAKGIYHYASAHAMSRFELVQDVWQALKAKKPLPCERVKPIHLSDLKGRAPRPHYTALSTELVERKFGLKPRSWSEILKAYIDAI